MTNVPELLKLSHDLSVLYVEDDIYIRKEMYEILDDLFDSVLLANDGEDGLYQFESYKTETGKYPDIIITDINMPKCNGVEMSKKIRERYAEQLIIVLSAHNESHYLLDLINMGIDHYLVKPVESVPLLQILQRAAKKIHYRDMELRYTKELEELAYKDPMTGISNRRRFFEKANTLFSNNTLKYASICLCIVDIDKFKQINDTYGHDMGDEVIRIFTNIVIDNMGENDCFARLGGDEFVMMFQASEDAAYIRIQNIQEQINMTHHILNTFLHFSVSIGMTEIKPEDNDIDKVIKRADICLYQEKVLKNNLLVVNL